MKISFQSGVVWRGNPPHQGAALIIILVLLTMIFLLPLAFFLQTANQRKLASGSSAMSMEATLAEGAIESIMSDLEQEIAWGSLVSYTVVTNVSAGTVLTNAVYYPTSSINSAPVLAGSSGTNGLENMIKRSAYGVSNFPGASCWAISLSSTNPSANGFAVPITRWNKHLLIARAYPGSPTDVTPTNSFTPPDWILIARDGSTPTNWNTNMQWSQTNATTVIGRYAYAMFDEGGLLDANVAGYPVGYDTNVSTAGAPPVAGKSGPYFSDLHQIGLNDAQITAMVGWRNYVTALAAGNYPNYTIPDNGTNFAQAVFGNGNGFIATFNTNVASGNAYRTDHQFSSRQQLISFLIGSDSSNIPKALEALRYLGNFGRDINQPSFAPATNRPKVGVGDDTTNPPFLSILVNSTNFTRNNGAIANVGDPLVKKRFPLNTLSWLTYAGPSSSVLSVTNPSYAALRTSYLNAGIPQTMLGWGTAYNISNYFGLTWNSNGVSAGSWTYRNGSNQPIMTLAQVQAVGRDPDFFELLKAAITYGSLGKSYSSNTNSTNTPEGYNATYDNWTDAQIIQIGANIIDQFDFDSYPTRIQFSDGTTFGGASVEIRGVEDLPYLYSVREGKVMTTDSVPSVSTLPRVTNGWSSTNGGSGIVLQEPEIWNPHAMRTNTTSNSGPTNFRLLAITTDPLSSATNGNTPTINYNIGAVWTPQLGTNIKWMSGTATNLNSSNAVLSFTIPTNRQDLFREPTLLIKPNIPSGCNLAGSATYTLGPSNNFTAAYQYGAVGVVDNRQYIGIPMGIVPMALSATFASNGIGTGLPATNNAAGIAPTGYVIYQTNGTTNAVFPAVTYSLQCQDGSGNWITYDQKYTSVANATNGYGIPNTGTNANSAVFIYNENKSFFVDSNNTSWSKNAIGSEWRVCAFDPRSSRFGMLFAGCNGGATASDSFPLGAALGGSVAVNNTPLYTLGWAAPIGTSATNTLMQYSAKQNALLSIRPDEYAGMNFSSLNTGPTASGWYPGGSNSLVRPGMFVQNNPNIPTPPGYRFNNDPQPPTGTRQFFADDDGVVRRGMSAFVPFTNSVPALYPIAASNYPSGIPMLTAYGFDSSGNATAITSGVNANEYLSRPVILNHPFRSVAELGLVFSGTPWRNLDFSSPESGCAALLDVFCINDTGDALALLAGKVNLNTRQIPVLQAILAGAYKEEFNGTNPLVNSLISSNMANAVAQAVITRTHATNTSAGPFMNIGDLVGRWNSSTAVSGASYVNGSSSYVGFTDDQTSASINDLTALMSNTLVATDPELRIERVRDASIRALASSGQTRVWNVMIDLLVQQGRFPKSSSGYTGFIVDGEVHYWVHLSIDRLTGKLLDRRVENVKE